MTQPQQQMPPSPSPAMNQFPMGVRPSMPPPQQQQQMRPPQQIPAPYLQQPAQLQQMQQMQQMQQQQQPQGGMGGMGPPGIVNATFSGSGVPMGVSSSSVGPNGQMPHPIVILKGHDDKLREHEGGINDLSNRVNYLNTRIDELSKGRILQSQQPTAVQQQQPPQQQATNVVVEEETVEDDDEEAAAFETIVGELLQNRDFISGVVDTIVNDTNLSEVIRQIEPVVAENRELRSLIHSQQETLNSMNTVVYKLLTRIDRLEEEENKRWQQQQEMNGQQQYVCDPETGTCRWVESDTASEFNLEEAGLQEVTISEKEEENGDDESVDGDSGSNAPHFSVAEVKEEVSLEIKAVASSALNAGEEDEENEVASHM
jgi:hypothetical protein